MSRPDVDALAQTVQHALSPRRFDRESVIDAEEALDALVGRVRELEAALEAAVEVDTFLSADGPPFRFDGTRISTEAETALLILHDTINDVAAAALAPSAPREPGDERAS